MSWQGTDDKIAELLKQAYPPAAASPEFKAALRQQLAAQGAAVATGSPKPLWQQPFVWVPAAAASAVAIVLVILLVAFQSVPPTVTTRDASGIQTTTATLNGRLDSLGESESVEVSFEWGTTADYGNETTPELRTESGDITASLNGLRPDTTYHYRLKVVSREGTKYGPDIQFTTGPAPPVTTTKDAVHVKATSATLEGNLDDLGSAEGVSVSFKWGLTTSYSNETTPESMTKAGQYSADLSGLAPGTTYYYRAKADGDGDPVYGEQKSFTTKTVAPSVDTKPATDVATTSATLNGDLTSLGTARSVNVFFEYGSATGSYVHTTVNQARASTGSFSAVLSGLDPGTTYYFRGKADGDGDPIYGTEKTFTTLTAPPLVSTNSATEVHCTSAALHGVLVGLGTASDAKVSFEWGVTTTYGQETTPETKTETGAFNASVTALIPRTTYHFRAKAVGVGIAYGEDMMFTTGEQQPPQGTWYLGSELSDSAHVMYHDNTSTPLGTVPLHSNGSSSVSTMWKTDEYLAGETYPGDNWTVHLTLNHLTRSHEVIVEIGTLDNSGFNSQGTYTLIASGTNNQDVYQFEFSIWVDPFTVPSNGYVATRITVTSRYRLWVDVHVGGSQSYVTSPASPEIAAPEVTTGAATSVGQTTAILNGYVDDLGSASGVTVWFEWGTTIMYGNEIEVGSQISDGSFSFVLTDLAPNTTYHFRTRVVGDGTNYGVDMTFTTLP